MRHLIPYISKIVSAFKKRDQRALRKLNDEVMKATAVDCEQVCFDVVVYSYVLSKIVSKPRLLGPEFRSALISIEHVLDRIEDAIESGNKEEALGLFFELQKAIGRLEERDPRFVIGLVTKGKLKMAATLYAQGISLGVAADITGLEKQEILDYAGETMMFDRLKDEKSIAERMKIARKLLSD